MSVKLMLQNWTRLWRVYEHVNSLVKLIENQPSWNRFCIDSFPSYIHSHHLFTVHLLGHHSRVKQDVLAICCGPLFIVSTDNFMFIALDANFHHLSYSDSVICAISSYCPEPPTDNNARPNHPAFWRRYLSQIHRCIWGHSPLVCGKWFLLVHHHFNFIVFIRT